jgi:ATP-binding cassette subfamily B protein
MEDVHEAARRAQAHDFIMEMKDGYSTRVGERGGRISGGQRQRIAIARVFLRKPKIILLDEATSALDENSQQAVQDALNTLIKECNATVVLVAHRLSTVMNAHKIAVIEKGKVAEQGSHDDLVRLGGIYAKLVEKTNKKKENALNQAAIDGDGDGEGGGKKSDVDNIDSLLGK